MTLHLVVFLVVFRTTSEEQFHPERKSREKIQSDGFNVSKLKIICLRHYGTLNGCSDVGEICWWKKYVSEEFCECW